MIQFNNVSPALSSSGGSLLNNSTDSSLLDSFENALSEAISQTLQQYGINPNSLNISIGPSAASAGTSSSAAATTTSAASTAATSSANTTSTSASNASTTSTSNASATSAAAATTTSPTSTTTTSSAAPATSSPSSTNTTPVSASSDAETAEESAEAFDQAYWAAQPAAVQALQNIQDPDERTQMATQLANEGYTIDVPIMVWGWDPAQVTSLRESYGYSWVPSALQSPVESAPGISETGLQVYNANNPPSGSISV